MPAGTATCWYWAGRSVRSRDALRQPFSITDHPFTTETGRAASLKSRRTPDPLRINRSQRARGPTRSNAPGRSQRRS
jgi:hypothetical protein